MSETLKATVLRFSQFGNPFEVIVECEEIIEIPKSGNKLLVKIIASTINPADIITIRGLYAVKPELPAVPGNECVAEVLTVGSEVKQFKKGDLVVPVTSGLGTWRSHAVWEDRDVIKIPTGISVGDAAGIVVNPSTAYRMLKDFVQLKEGDVIIQNAANSACGQLVIQLCKAWGIKVVGVVRSRPDIEEVKQYLKNLGANEILTEEECSNTKIFDGSVGLLSKPVLALNSVGGESASVIMKHLAYRGTLVSYGNASKQPVIVPIPSLIYHDLKVVGFWRTRWIREHHQKTEMYEMFKNLFDMILAGKLKAPGHQFIAVENFKDALQKSVQGQGFSNKKIILKF